jgi:hypothetical protein
MLFRHVTKSIAPERRSYRNEKQKPRDAGLFIYAEWPLVP